MVWFPSQREGLRTGAGADGESPCLKLRGRQPRALLSEGKRRGTSQLTQRAQPRPSSPLPFCSGPIDGMMSTHTGEGNLLSPPIQRLISSRDTLTPTLTNVSPALSASFGPGKLTQKINLHKAGGSLFVSVLSVSPRKSILNAQPEEHF